MPVPGPDLTGKTFHRLRVLGKGGVKNNNREWLCICECGQRHSAPASALTHGRIKSCGCLNAELRAARNTVHGLTPRGTFPDGYWVWQAMLRRCDSEKNADFKSYGGRGISVCERWRNSFTDFIADMGPKPTPKHSLDRKDNDGNYGPSNCRWATAREQRMNQRRMARAS